MQPLSESFAVASPPDTGRLGVLTIGFAGLTVGTFLAWRQPAEAYELSIFSGTPLGFWVGLLIAFFAAAVTVLGNYRDATAGLALVLGGVSTLTFISLPIIRGYRFHGLADALTHLGWADSLRSGEMAFTDLLYPASHSMSAIMAELGGVPTEHAMMFTVVILVGLFLVFVPVSVFAITNHPAPTVIAAFSGMLVIPITNIQFMLHFHTYTLTTMLIPMFVYLLVRYSFRPEQTRLGRDTLNAWRSGVILVGLSLLVFHPQVKLNVIILLGAFVILAFVYRFYPDHPFSKVRSPHLGFGLLTGAWVAWLTQFSEVAGVGERVLAAVIDTMFGDASPGETVTAQGESLLLIGGSLTEIYLKIFLIPTVFLVFGIYLSGLVLLRRFRHDERQLATTIAYFTFGGIVLLPFFLLHYAGAMSHLFFRHVGFSLALLTIFGAIGVYRLAGPTIRLDKHTVRSAVVIVFVIALILSLLVVYPSPYIYKQNHHVTNQDMAGYTSAFDVTDETIPFSEIRSSKTRYHDAIATGDQNPTIESMFSGEDLSAAHTFSDSSYYLPVSVVDYQREVVAYQEVRFSSEDFHSLESNHHVDRVSHSGEYSLYLVNRP